MPITDNFDSYSNGDLNGQGSWAGDTAFDVQGSVVQGGTKAIIIDGAESVKTVKKSFTGTNAGYESYYIRTDTGGATYEVSFYEGANKKEYTGFNWGGGAGSQTIGFFYSGWSWEVLVAAPAALDTWYKVDIEWRIESTVRQIRGRANGGSWSNWRTALSTWTTLDNLSLETTNQSFGKGYWDTLSDTDVVIKPKSYGLII